LPSFQRRDAAKGAGWYTSNIDDVHGRLRSTTSVKH